MATTVSQSEFQAATALIDSMLQNPEEALMKLQQAWDTKASIAQVSNQRRAATPPTLVVPKKKKSTAAASLSISLSSSSVEGTKTKRDGNNSTLKGQSNPKTERKGLDELLEETVRESLKHEMLVAVHPKHGVSEAVTVELHDIALGVSDILLEEERLYSLIETQFENKLAELEKDLEDQRFKMNHRHSEEIMRLVMEVERQWNAGLGRDKPQLKRTNGGVVNTQHPIQDDPPEIWPPENITNGAEIEQITDKRLLALYLRQIQRIHTLFRKQAWERTELLRQSTANVDTLFVTREDVMKKLLAETHSRLTALRNRHDEQVTDVPQSSMNEGGKEDKTTIGIPGGNVDWGRSPPSRSNSILEDGDVNAVTELLELKKTAKQFVYLLKRVRREQEHFRTDKDTLDSHLEEQASLTRSMLTSINTLQPPEGMSPVYSETKEEAGISIAEISTMKRRCLELCRENMQLLSQKSNLLRTINNQTRHLGKLREQLLALETYE